MSPEVVEIRTLEDALQLLDEWMAAYRELDRDYLRLQMRCDKANDGRESAEFLLRHLDPFLPDSMQNGDWKAADPRIYAALAPLRQAHKFPDE